MESSTPGSKLKNVAEEDKATTTDAETDDELEKSTTTVETDDDKLESRSGDVTTQQDAKVETAIEVH